jgi:hypothetical protein
MTATRVTPDPVIDDDFDYEDDDIVERGNWTEDRKEILKDVALDDIFAAGARLKAEHPEEYLSPEELRRKILQTPKTPPSVRRAEMVGA